MTAFDRVPGPLALALALAAAAACGDATGPGESGAITFSYEGELAGSFDVRGAPPTFSVEGVPEFGEWTLAAAGDSLGGVVISGLRTAADDTGDLFVLQLAEIRTGEFACSQDGECHGRILFGIPDRDGLPVGEAERWFEIVSGSVEVTEAGAGRVAGTFAFTARDEGGAGDATLTVEDGIFDLPLTSQSGGLSVICTSDRAAGEDCTASD